MKNAGLIGASIVGVILLFVLSIGLEVGGMKIGGFLAKERAKVVGEVNRVVVEEQDKTFKESTQYIDGMASELSEMWVELDSTENTARRMAIIKKIKRDYAEFDADKLENDQLRQFLIDVMSGYYN